MAAARAATTKLRPNRRYHSSHRCHSSHRYHSRRWYHSRRGDPACHRFHSRQSCRRRRPCRRPRRPCRRPRHPCRQPCQPRAADASRAARRTSAPTRCCSARTRRRRQSRCCLQFLAPASPALEPASPALEAGLACTRAGLKPVLEPEEPACELDAPALEAPALPPAVVDVPESSELPQAGSPKSPAIAIAAEVVPRTHFVLMFIVSSRLKVKRLWRRRSPEDCPDVDGYLSCVWESRTSIRSRSEESLRCAFFLRGIAPREHR